MITGLQSVMKYTTELSMDASDYHLIHVGPSTHQVIIKDWEILRCHGLSVVLEPPLQDEIDRESRRP